MQTVNRIYWTDTGKPGISYFDVGNNSVHSCVDQGLGSPLGIAVDSLSGKIYWTDSSANMVQSANMDGSEVKNIVEGIPGAGIAVDIKGSKIYWADCFQLKGNYRVNLDGTNLEIINKNLQLQVGVAINPITNKIYWADSESDKIQCSNLDGTNVEDVILGGGAPRCIVIDSENEKIYWTGLELDVIYCSNIDGSEIKDVVVDYGEPRGIGLYFE